MKNPVLGQVKTRLAVTVGEERALAVYRELLAHTRAVTQGLPCNKAVWYADFVNFVDLWETGKYQKHLQQGQDLGDRMAHAFAQAFAEGYTSVCIIGSDCHQITEAVLEEAFASLRTHEVVVGPSTDGGYYLLGMNRLHPDFFQSKAWSTPTVLADSLQDAVRLQLSVKLLPTLTDLDEEKDLWTLDTAK